MYHNRPIACLIALALVLPAFAGTHGRQLRVMTYNIRYDNPADSLDNWRYRKEFIAGMIHFYAPDILGIQEGLIHQVHELSDLLPEYNWCGKGRDDGREGGEFSALFFDRNRFRIIVDSTFWLSPTPDRPSRGWDAALNRIVTWASLKDTVSGDTVLIFNTHFDHRGESARLESARLLVREIRRIAAGHPVVLTGDFNSTNNDQPYQVLTASGADHELCLHDAISVSQSAHFGPLKTYSGFDVHQGIIGERIDFIFVSDSLTVSHHATLSDFMSNEHFPSDHLPVVADIVLP